MSAHGHATHGDAAPSHDHYEGIPADRPGPDEPNTPLWLPLVGIALLLSTLLAYVLTRPAGKTGAELAKEALPEGSAAPAAAASAPAPARPMRVPPGLGSAMPGMRPGAAPAGSAVGLPPRPAMAPAPGGTAAPRVNPPHGAPGHVH